MKKGVCNICGKTGPLTKDHLFPKSTVPMEPLDVSTLSQDLSCEPSRRQRALGAAVRRTICKDCNVDRLGGQYDPSLKAFGEEVACWIRAQYKHSMALPESFTVNAKPNRITRAVVGHLLAAELRPNRAAIPEQAPMPDAMRDYFLDQSLPLPARMELLYWPYPSQVQVIVRACGVMKYGKKGVVVGDCYKAFPIAFWLVWDRPDSVIMPLESLPTTGAIDEEIPIGISLRTVPRVDWPEAPGGDEFLLFNDSMSILSRRHRA